MHKEMAKIGMKVRIIKYDNSEREGWAPSQASRHVGLICQVEKRHPEYNALNLKITDPIIGEVQWWWYHADDVEPLISSGKNYKKKVNFNPENLVTGV